MDYEYDVNKFPYGCEYAKSNRSKCRRCNVAIPKDEVRLSVRISAENFYGVLDHWHHQDCFWSMDHDEVTETSILGFSALRYDDQKRIRLKIAEWEDTKEKNVRVVQRSRSRSESEANGNMELDGEVVDLPYGCDYAKSSRARCRGCSSLISQDELRMSARVRAQNFDGVMDQWYHYSCFWRYDRGDITEASIKGFSSLRWEDQEKIRREFNELDAMRGDGVHQTKSKSAKRKSKAPSNKQKRPTGEDEDHASDSIALSCEYAKTSRGKCGECAEIIEQNDVRIKYKSRFYHPECMENMGIYGGVVEDIANFGSLEPDEQEKLRSIFTANHNSEGSEGDSEHGFVGNVAEDSDSSMGSFIEPTDESSCLKSSEDEESTTPTKRSNPASGSSKDSEDAEPTPPKRSRLTDSPKRMAALKTQAQCLWKVMDEIKPVFRQKEPLKALISANGSYVSNNTSIAQALEMLADIIIFGGLPRCGECGKKLLRWDLDKNTYQCCSYVTNNVRCPFSDRFPSRKPFVLPREYMDNAILAKYAGKTILPNGRVYSQSVMNNEIVVRKPQEPGAHDDEEGEERRRCVVKNGTIVDGRCEDADRVHVYIDQFKRPWQALLMRADIARGTNSYYKLQLVKYDYKQEYSIFRSWGRVGTRGGAKTENFGGDLNSAMQEFERLFLEKSQNEWDNVDNFVKVAGGMDLVEIEIDDAKIESKRTLNAAESASKLSIELRECISLFFDMTLMTQQMAEFQLDTSRLPLAKLSKKQLLRAHSILSQLSDVLSQDHPSAIEIQDLNNQFYMVLPHASGVGNLQRINTLELLKSKTEMVDSLLELEVAYTLMENKEEDEIDPFDRHYLSLKCKIELIGPESEEARIIRLFAANSHMKTHTFKIHIKQIFKVEREGETERYEKKSKDIENKRLLVHGSRTSNFAGILSQGLRIAPPEAPVNGYMFGKGLYFADSFSKSAQYCSTPGRSDAFLVLVEVALGKMQTEKHAKNIEKPDPSYSSVMALGQTGPDYKDSVKLGDILVPVGKSRTDTKNGEYSLRYNEFIVYDEAQARIRYLIHADITY